MPVLPDLVQVHYINGKFYFRQIALLETPTQFLGALKHNDQGQHDAFMLFTMQT